MRPTERPVESVTALRDPEVADWLEARDRAALLFWDESDDASRRLRARVELVAASANVALGVVDVRHDALVARALGVTSVPTVVVFRGGAVAERLLGVAPESVLRDAMAGPHPNG